MERYSRAFKNHEGKSSDKWESYLKVYDSLLSNLQVPITTILEIGVQNGGSLEVWAVAAPEAHKILGVDVNPLCGRLSFDDARIEVQITDGSATQAASMLDAAPTLVVDDGSHISSEVIQHFVEIWPLLSPGGAYVIEDLCASYWPNYLGGLNRADTSMQFLKSLVDQVNSQHWTKNNSVESQFHDFQNAFSKTFLASLNDIQTIEFGNSICVITKREKDSVWGIGPRRIAGLSASVDPTVTGTDGQAIEDAPMSPLHSDSGEESTKLRIMEVENRNLRKRIANHEASRSWKVEQFLSHAVALIKKK